MDENFTADHQQVNNDAIQGGGGGGTDSHYRGTSTNNDYILDEDNIKNDDNYDDGDNDDKTIEAIAAVTDEHQLLKKKETAAKLQKILDSVKGFTNTIFCEIGTYLHEMEEVEKTYIQCRANTQKEQRRMECEHQIHQNQLLTGVGETS